MKGFAWWDRLQGAEAKVVARVRAAIGLVAGGALAPALMIEEPRWVKPTSGAAFAVCLVLALLLRAGEKNDEPEKSQKLSDRERQQ